MQSSSLSNRAPDPEAGENLLPHPSSTSTSQVTVPMEDEKGPTSSSSFYMNLSESIGSWTHNVSGHAVHCVGVVIGYGSQVCSAVFYSLVDLIEG